MGLHPWAMTQNGSNLFYPEMCLNGVNTQWVYSQGVIQKPLEVSTLSCSVTLEKKDKPFWGRPLLAGPPTKKGKQNGAAEPLRTTLRMLQLSPCPPGAC